MLNQVERIAAERGDDGARYLSMGKGGKATGARKARSPEHYRKMVEARTISSLAAKARKAKRKQK